MDYDSYTWKKALVDITEDDDLSEVVDILGFEVIAICTPDTLDGSNNDITLQIDPGDGTYRDVVQADGSAIQWANVGTDEFLMKPDTFAPITGANLKLALSSGESADREFLVVLKQLT